MPIETTPQGQVPAATPMQEQLKEVGDRLKPRIEEAQARLSEVNERVKDFIREHPGASLLGAAAIGFMIGRWASRR